MADAARLTSVINRLAKSTNRQDREQIVEDIGVQLEKAEDKLVAEADGTSLWLSLQLSASRVANVPWFAGLLSLSVVVTSLRVCCRVRIVGSSSLTHGTPPFSLFAAEHHEKFYDALEAFQRVSETINDSKMKVGMLREALTECRSYLQVRGALLAREPSW